MLNIPYQGATIWDFLTEHFSPGSRMAQGMPSCRVSHVGHEAAAKYRKPWAMSHTLLYCYRVSSVFVINTFVMLQKRWGQRQHLQGEDQVEGDNSREQVRSQRWQLKGAEKQVRGVKLKGAHPIQKVKVKKEKKEVNKKNNANNVRPRISIPE